MGDSQKNLRNWLLKGLYISVHGESIEMPEDFVNVLCDMIRMFLELWEVKGNLIRCQVKIRNML